jgi:polyphosphate kinase 2 (PPK2 family)
MNPNADSSTPKAKLKRNKHDEEPARLHVDLVKPQQWVVCKGLKVCVVFEGA